MPNAGDKTITGEKTITFSIREEKEQEIRRVLGVVYEALKEKGYNPINQIVGYILSEDPTFITAHRGARSMICKLERDDILNILVRNFLNV